MRAGAYLMDHENDHWRVTKGKKCWYEEMTYSDVKMRYLHKRNDGDFHLA